MLPNKKETTLLTYEYYDTPEGCDLLYKMAYVGKYGFFANVIFSLHDIMLYSKPPGTILKIARFAYLGVPFIVAPLAAVVVSNISTSLRGKNDKVNYALGGAAAGGVLSAFFKTSNIVFPVLMGVAGMFRKDLLEKGYDLFPDEITPMPERTGLSKKFDFSLVEERRGNWTRE